MNFKLLILAMAGMALLSYACKNDPINGAIETGLDPMETAGIQKAFQVPEQAFLQGHQAVNSGAWMINQASLIQGGLTTTGTLIQLDQGLGYQPFPDDRLVFQDLNGATLATYRIDVLQGNLTGDEQTYLSGDHNFAFQVEVPQLGNLQITSLQEGSNRSLTFMGEIVFQGDLVQVDLLMEGTYFFEVDNTGSEIRIRSRYSGTAVGQEFSEKVDESWNYTSVYASGQGGFVAENAIREFNSNWLVGNHQFAYQNGLVQTVFRDGRPSEWDVNQSPWHAEGDLLLDGQAIGNLTMGSEGDYIKVWMQTGEQRTEVNQWRF